MSSHENDPAVGRHGRGANALGSTQGATAVDERKRRGGWLWLLLLLLVALIVLAVLGGVLGWFSSGKSKHAAAATPTTLLAAGSNSATTVPVPGGESTPTTLEPAGNSTDTTAGTTAGATAGGDSLPPAGLIGGGGVKPVTAAGQVAAAGSVGDVLFDENSSKLDSNANSVITEAVREITAAHATSVNVVGYTDSIGDAVVNQKLSMERAVVVETALKQQTASSVTYTAKAEGQSKPVASNATSGGRRLNRRVSIFDK